MSVKLTLAEIINAIYPLPQASYAALEAHIQLKVFASNSCIIQADIIDHRIYFVRKGVVRAYSPLPDQDITFWFGQEGSTVISLNSYIRNGTGYETIETLENCELYCLDARELHKLYEQDIAIANWGRKLAELELLKTEERLIIQQSYNATKRYQLFFESNASLLQRVNLGYIASYLGITQVSLSRIRAEVDF